MVDMRKKELVKLVKQYKDDRDRALEGWKEAHDGWQRALDSWEKYSLEYSEICKQILKKQKADIKHGMWIKEIHGGHRGYVCTSCQHFDTTFEPDGYMHYCPFCGSMNEKWG